MGLVAIQHMGLPGPGIQPVSTILAGGFFTTEPPGKPHPLPLEPPFPCPPSHPPRWSPSPRQGFLCYTSASHRLSILHMGVHIHRVYSLNSSHPLLPLLCPHVCSLCLHLCSCPPNRFIRAICVDSKAGLLYPTATAVPQPINTCFGGILLGFT